MTHLQQQAEEVKKVDAARFWGSVQNFDAAAGWRFIQKQKLLFNRAIDNQKWTCNKANKASTR